VPHLSVKCDNNRWVHLLICRVYGNHIARLPPSLKKLRYLKRFMANNNQLVEVPENVMFMFVLEKLYFNGNEVATFSEVQSNACLLLLPVSFVHLTDAEMRVLTYAEPLQSGDSQIHLFPE